MLSLERNHKPAAHCGRRNAGPATPDRTMETTMPRLLRAARDNVSDIVAAVAASAYFFGFVSALYAALAKLAY